MGRRGRIPQRHRKASTAKVAPPCRGRLRDALEGPVVEMVRFVGFELPLLTIFNDDGLKAQAAPRGNPLEQENCNGAVGTDP